MKKFKKKILALMSFFLFAGSFETALRAEEPFAKFIKPITNPIYFDTPINTTYIHVITAYQNLPSRVNTTLGNLPLDGHLQVGGAGISLALNQRFSLLGVKGGYIHLHPKKTLKEKNGWADIALGVKYAFIIDKEKEFIFSGKLLFELSQGSRDVFHGNGGGNVSPSLSFLKGYKNFQLCGMVGGIIPFDSREESTILFHSWHISYDLMEGLHFRNPKNKVFPLLELNHFHLLDNGHCDEFVASAVQFEGGDAVNLGAQNAEDHPDFVSLGVGFRYRSHYSWLPIDLGFCYEFPLSQKENSIMGNRLTWDVVYRF